MPDDDQVDRLLDRTRKASGVPRYIEEPALLALVAELIHRLD